MGQSSVNCTCRLGVCLWEFTPAGLFQEIRAVQYIWSITGHQTDDGSWWIAMTHHRLSVCDMSAIKHCAPHLYGCLWCHYFRTRNVITLLSPVHLCCLWVIAIHHEPSPLFGDPLQIRCIRHVCQNGTGVQEEWTLGPSFFELLYICIFLWIC